MYKVQSTKCNVPSKLPFDSEHESHFFLHHPEFDIKKSIK